MEDLKKIERFFDNHAEEYFKQRIIKGGRLFNEFIEMPASKSLLGRKINSESTLLDIGCGIGSYSKYYGELGAKVIGIDLSKNMLNIAKDVCQKLKNVEFYQASFEEFDFKKKKFDYILGGFMLSYFKDLNKALLKISNLLNPNGVAVLSMLHPIKLSIKSELNGLFCFSNYFDENDYITDLSFKDDVISLKKWTVEDIFEASKKSTLFIDSIKEPRPDIPPNLELEKSDFYFSCPSIIVFRFKKRN